MDAHHNGALAPMAPSARAALRRVRAATLTMLHDTEVDPTFVGMTPYEIGTFVADDLRKQQMPHIDLVLRDGALCAEIHRMVRLIARLRGEPWPPPAITITPVTDEIARAEPVYSMVRQLVALMPTLQESDDEVAVSQTATVAGAYYPTLVKTVGFLIGEAVGLRRTLRDLTKESSLRLAASVETRNRTISRASWRSPVTPSSGISMESRRAMKSSPC